MKEDREEEVIDSRFFEGISTIGNDEVEEEDYCGDDDEKKKILQ